MEPKSILIDQFLSYPLRNVNNAASFAIDIGGSLTKLAYYSTVKFRINKVKRDEKELYDVSETDKLLPRLHFIVLENQYLMEALDFIRDRVKARAKDEGPVEFFSTGGGSIKYANLLKEKIGFEAVKLDEIACVVKGCNFLLRNIPHEAFSFEKKDDTEPKFSYEDFTGGGNDENLFPYLLVNIGSGVSICCIRSADEWERVGGTSMGGGTFWGLGRLLTGKDSFDDILELAEKGSRSGVDTVVRDIYGGGDYGNMGLSGDITASSFCKAATQKTKTIDEFSPEDRAKSLLHMISNDIGQLAYLYAKLNDCKRVIFGGFFIRGHLETMRTVSFGINYWSKGTIQPLFLRHEGFLGTIGAFMQSSRVDKTKLWGENFALSSGYREHKNSTSHDEESETQSISTLELDQLDIQCEAFPYTVEPYKADQWDLTDDHDSRTYWLDTLKASTDKTGLIARQSQPTSEDVDKRVNEFKEKYIKRLDNLRRKPGSYGRLSVRKLLNMREDLLNELLFPDTYIKIKKRENEYFLPLLAERLKQLDEIDNRKDQWEAAFKGVLAGNMFDWGAKAVTDMFDDNDNGLMQFSSALDKIQPRKWLVDDFDVFFEQLSGYKCVCLFCDNSGADIILGVLPFVRQLLRENINVVLVANSKPALNDVTYSELVALMPKVTGLCPEFEQFLTDEDLILHDNESSSPCLNLKTVPTKLVEILRAKNCDLLIFEGMGRAIHTNYNSQFRIDSIKLAVLKNKWIAGKYGGKLFDVVCKYDKGIPLP